jgi:hypothetical protein
MDHYLKNVDVFGQYCKQMMDSDGLIPIKHQTPSNGNQSNQFLNKNELNNFSPFFSSSAPQLLCVILPI